MSKHTPGPWAAVDDACGSYVVVTHRDHRAAEGWTPQPHDASICMGIGDHTERRTSGNEQANAHLIAAAPDLLVALVESRQVIATALKSGAPDWFDTDEAIASHHTIKKIDAALAKARGES